MNTSPPAQDPGDPDATVLIPAPGGRRAPSSPPPAPSSPDPARPAMPGGGLNRLVRLANRLLDALVPLRGMSAPPDMEQLRHSLTMAVRDFEQAARAAGIDHETIAAARYALCTALDETIARTAWGSGVWGQRSLLVTFHNEASGGEKFFAILHRLSQDPQANLDLIELMYLCLALGLEGRYRMAERGGEQLAGLRERLYGMIAGARGTPEAALSPQWRGAAGPAASPLRRIPVWVLAAVAATVLLALQLTYARQLGRAAEPVYASLGRLQLPVVQIAPPRLSEPEAAPAPRVARFLAREIAAGQVGVVETAERCVISLTGQGMFDAGSADVAAGAEALLERIGLALRPLPGRVIVVGHTDDSKPGLSARFPNNHLLSKARADSVRQLLARVAGPPARYAAEGHGDLEPLVPNDTPAQRARNRRVEITVLTPAPPP
ncbi:MAG: type IVB secretion system protein IcmH/DotU [Pseudomonadota bacterium]